MISERPETGPMRFEGDWRGVFLRGDHACHYAAQLEAALDPRNGPEMRALFAEQLRPLVALLNGANEFVETPGEQVLRPFAACPPAEAAALDLAPLDLGAIDREAARLLDGITPEPWKLSLIHGVPMLYGADGVSPVAFTMYAETATADGCPQADANAALIEAAPVLARRVRALVARLGALVWAVLDERRMKALHRAALREEINAAILDTDSDRENAAMADSRETAEAAEEAAARLDDLLRGGAPKSVPADVVRRYVEAVDAHRRAGVMPSSDDPARAQLRDAQAALLDAFAAANSPAPVTDALAIRLAEALIGTLPDVPVQVGAGAGELVVYVPARAKVRDDAVPLVFQGVSVRVVRLGNVAPAAEGAPR